ncbi:LytR/AlgR family response regulator transcription factor [Flavihumibacter sp. UBA7668]|uniref:LytR/AlgR family response regulator transcription factor n=1 Tax=Flavihumibacter sp. UBA7668 TaxID=1946542 RepID=UPI0025C44BEE|nr:LytTR family DNA-binding domain-containing protein [Flavihumibacter sp. UBA7668]
MQLLIVEDENLLANQLIRLLREVEPEAVVAGRTNSVASTLQYLQNNAAPDLILMDIELGDGQCFELFDQIQISSPIIFTTAYDEFTLKAFKLNSVDYLLKPIDPVELKAALTKFRQVYGQHSGEQINQLLHQLQAAQPYRTRFLVKQGQQLQMILTQEIAYLHALNKVNFLFTHSNKKYILEYSLDELENMLNPAEFFRINRQTILNISSIQTIHPWFKGKVKLELKIPSLEEILVSRERATAFKTWLGA